MQPPPRRTLLKTARGANQGAFGPAEWGLLAVASLIWGASFLFIAEALESFHPFVITTGRILLGLLALAPIQRTRRRIDRDDWPAVVLLGALWMTLPFVLFGFAERYITSALAGVVNGAMPIFSAVIAAAWLRAKPAMTQRVGIGVGFVGVATVMAPAFGEEASASLLGVVLALGATMAYAISVNIAVPLQQRYGAFPVLLRTQAAALILSAPFGLWGLTQSTFSWKAAAALGALGVFGTGWAFVAMATLIGRAGATRGAVVVYFIPIVAIILGVVLRDETVSAMTIAGSALVLGGAYLTSRKEAPRVTPQPAA